MNSRLTPFHYLSTDPVNIAAAEELAAARGLDLDLLELAEPRDMPRIEKQNALLIVDWDHIPPDYRDRVLDSPALRVVAIHGYGVSDSVARFLPRRGILYFKRLGPELFRRLDDLEPAA